MLRSHGNQGRWTPICRFPGQSRLKGRVKSVSYRGEPVPEVIGVDARRNVQTTPARR